MRDFPGWYPHTVTLSRHAYDPLCVETFRRAVLSDSRYPIVPPLDVVLKNLYDR
jgi:hypothetical protein